MKRGLIALTALIAHLNLANRHPRRLITLIALFTHFYLAVILYDGHRNELSRGRTCPRSQKTPAPTQAR